MPRETVDPGPMPEKFGWDEESSKTVTVTREGETVTMSDLNK